MEVGGQLTTTTEVENWPGGHAELQGPELMMQMAEHVERFDAQIINDHIHTADLSSKPLRLIGDQATYTCDALVIATGASAKYLGLPSEEAYKGRGVSACATCDGFFYRGQDVAVIGGGNTAAEEALYLANITNKVYLVHRRDQMRAEKILQDRLLNKENIEPVWNHQLTEVLGDDGGVTGMQITNNDGTAQSIDLTGVFIAIGHTPNTGILRVSWRWKTATSKSTAASRAMPPPPTCPVCLPPVMSRTMSIGRPSPVLVWLHGGAGCGEVSGRVGELSVYL